MNAEKLQTIIQKIVQESAKLKNKHTTAKAAPVNYACIFSQNKQEYDELLVAAHKIGKIIKETPTGFLFQIEPIQTSAGVLKLLKIRLPDKTRLELGDADFTIDNFFEFEKKYLSKKAFKLISKENFYMIELRDPEFNVRTYFSNPPLDKQIGIT